MPLETNTYPPALRDWPFEKLQLPGPDSTTSRSFELQTPH